MILRRSSLAELEPAQRALAEGRYDVAFTLLENAARRPRPPAAQAQYWLHLAAVYALYGEEGLENGGPALKSAVGCDPNLVEHPLYQALFWEFAAYRGGGVSDVKRGLRLATTGDNPIAVYHASSALLAVGAAKSSARRLEALDEASLPAYLVWRRWSLLGQSYETLGDWDAAAAAYLRAVEAAPAEERDAELVSHASCLLELGNTADVIATLARVEEDRLGPDDRATMRYVEGRAHLDAGNPNRAVELFVHARSLDPVEVPTFSLAYAMGQALSAIGRFDEAVAALREAIEVAPADHRAYAQHEAAFALSESDHLSEAEAMLEEVVSDPAYPHRPEAVADLADVRLKMGEFDSAESLAEQALEMGATATGCLVLGSLAFEYYRLDDAVRWFEQAISASSIGDASWLAAHQVLADVYAQKGESSAERVLHHAVAALEHTEPGSEWRLPLQRHVEWARAALGGHDRVLN